MQPDVLTREEYNLAVTNYADNVYRFVLSRTRQPALAQDLVQDSFAKVWVKRQSIDAEKVKSYLFTTAHRLVIDHVRKKKESTEESDLAAGENHTALLPTSPDVSDILEKALDRLPELQKSLVLLRDYEGYSYEEMADICDISEQQVKVYLFRARKKLKDYLVSADLII